MTNRASHTIHRIYASPPSVHPKVFFTWISEGPPTSGQILFHKKVQRPLIKYELSGVLGVGTASLRHPIDCRITNRVLPWNDASVVFYTRLRQHLSLLCRPHVPPFRPPYECFRARNRRPAKGTRALRVAPFFSGYKFTKVGSSGQYRNPGITRASFLPPPSASPPEPLSDRFFFLPLHRTRLLFVRGEKKSLAASLPRATWLVAFFFHSRRAPLSLVFPRFPNLGDSDPPVHGWVPRPTSGKTDQGNEFSRFFSFFYTYTYIRTCTRVSFALPPLLLLPPSSSLSLPSFVRASVGSRAITMRRKKISLKICLTVQLKLGPVLPIMGFLLAPRVSSNDRGCTLTSPSDIVILFSRLFTVFAEM